VSAIRELYAQFRYLVHEGGKFLVVGAFGAIVTIGGADAMHDIGKYLAITIATVAGTIVTYLGNRYWTFTHRQGQGHARDTVVFFVLNGVGLLIYYACIWLIQDVAGLAGRLWYLVALIVGTALGTIFRFWSYRKWVWKAVGGPAGHGDVLPVPEASGGPEQERLTPAGTATGPHPVNPSRTGGAHRRQ
jgi:putative flippase GtrA